jgi:4-amino-4-deoxy-L-arabinose transferase-like glycosyltransferase
MSPLLTADALPLDVVENSVWGAERVLISYKNPALSSLLLEATRIVTGSISWPAYVLSQFCVCITFVMVFLLGREPLGDARALAGTLLLTACYYFGWHTPEFNQDIVETPFWAATALTLWRAVDRNKPLWWIALGVVAAGSLYGKLSAVVLLIAAGLWFVMDQRARSKLATPGPWIALAVFALVAAPLAYVLAHGDLNTIADYAVTRGKGHAANSAKWLLLQSAMIVPMVTVAWVCGLLPGNREASNDEAATDNIRERDRRFTAFLLWMTIAPIILTAIAAYVERTGAKLMWGVPMMNLTGLLIVALAASRVDDHVLRHLFQISLALILSVAMASAADTYFRPQFSTEPTRQNWPQAAIAQRFRDIWQTETGQPLRIVAGEPMNWAGGLVSLAPGDMPSIFTGADYARSPWITPERVAREGVLVVWPDKGTGTPNELAAIVGTHVPRYEEFPLRHPGRAKSVRVGYVVIPRTK